MKDDSFGEKIFNIFNIVFMILAGFTFLYPFINILAISLNEAWDSARGAIYFLPRKFTLDSYKFIFKNQEIFNAAQMSVARTVAGTILVIFCSSIFAYVFTQQQFIYYKPLKFIFFLAMFIPGGGLIPTFLLYMNLGLLNTFWVYIIPGMVALWDVVLFRTYMMGLPKGLEEAAKIDGANELKIYFRVILPLITPILAFLSLMAAVGQWNSWVDTLFYARNLKTLQFVMMEIINSSVMIDQDIKDIEEKLTNVVNSNSVKMAISIVATVPILMVYPFLQKYFVKGIVVGSMKG